MEVILAELRMHANASRKSKKESDLQALQHRADYRGSQELVLSEVWFIRHHPLLG